ncbi:hypothetical protein SDC9_151390 [bioreactor metagenome]|uniref:DUF2500 domain-containing protein n=1 Tax=bioreactor metagenome TaxID=1076179 RepID=A0A645EUI6_9ZZZZ|nr:DUF2500 domain-containing protein [Erysipelotrichaceae bacterium]
MSFFGGYNNSMFGFMTIFISLIFIAVFGLTIIIIIKSLGQVKHNSHSPVLAVGVKVVAKRTDAGMGGAHPGINNDVYHSAAATWYYITFEVESNDRLEFSVSALDFGQIAEGDLGKLTFQGTRFIRFERQ